MALSKASLKEKLEAQGFVLTGEFAMAEKMAEAIANAVVIADEIRDMGWKTKNGTPSVPFL